MPNPQPGFHRLAAAIVIGVVFFLAYGRASAQTPDVRNGDGRVSEFYTWTGAIPKPGTPLRTEALPPTLGLAGATGVRFLYASTDGVDGTSRVAVSGALFVPAGTAPRGGWPVIAWAHGTVGIADICAPSWSARSYRDVAYLQTWLAQGYAIVATDYQGLGTPGVHPYLNARSEAYSVLDSVRAALTLEPSFAHRIVIVGQSQGAGAAFATAGYASRYAPDLDLRGTVATGIPYFAPDAPSASPSDPTAVDPGIAYIFYLVLGLQPNDPSIVASDVFAPPALPLFEQARSSCISALEDDVTLAGLTDATALRPGLRAILAKHFPDLEYVTLTIASPVFVGTGLADHDVRPAVQQQLVKDACAAGTVVEAHTYAGLSHSQTVNASLRDSLPFVRKAFAGTPIARVCAPVPETL